MRELRQAAAAEPSRRRRFCPGANCKQRAYRARRKRAGDHKQESPRTARTARGQTHKEAIRVNENELAVTLDAYRALCAIEAA